MPRGGGGGKNDFMTPKAIAKYLKSKGLGKQHLYCQMCRKQCRDDNGFKCHQTSEKHLARMAEFGENPEKFLDQFSGEFERGMMAIIRNSFKNQWVEINQVYNDYIRMRNQTRLNGTRWITLTQFVIHVGESGLAKVENRGEKGWYVMYVEKGHDMQLKEKREKQVLDDEERNRLDLEKRLLLAQQTERKEAPPPPTDLDLEKKSTVKFSLQVKPKLKMNDEEPEKEEPKAEPIKEKKRKEAPEVFSPQDEKKIKLEKQSTRKTNWLVEDIVVKVVDQKLGDGKYYKQKGVVSKVTDNGFGASITLENGTKLKLEQKQLETVIPNIGKKVKIVNGLYRGEIGTLEAINMDKFCVQIKIETGKNKGNSSWEEYEDVCKIPEK